MRLWFPLVILGTIHAQDTTFRVGTQLVQVDVVVKNAKGSVRGLEKRDFTLFDNGKPVQIAVFAMREESKPRQIPLLEPGVVTNEPLLSGTEPVSATVILFDFLNTDAADLAYGRLQALKYLEKAQRREQVAIYTLNKTLKVAQHFTADHDQLVATIQKLVPETSVDLTAGGLVNDLPVTGDAIADGMMRNAAKMMQQNARSRREDITSAALATVARHLKGVPGRKKLIWISSSLPMAFHDTQEHNGVTTIEDEFYAEKIDVPGKLLVEANVALYGVDPKGLTVSGDGLADVNLEAMIRLASLTGGKAVYMDNGVAEAIEESIEDTDVTYTLGFYPGGENDGAFHSLRVKVDKPGLEVRYRKGYSAEQFRPLLDKQRGSTLTAWAEEPLDATEIPISAIAVKGPKAGTNRVNIGVDLSALHLEQRNGRWTGRIEVAILTGKDRKTQGVHQTIRLNLTPERLQTVLKTGLVVSSDVPIARPNGKPLDRELHIVVMDGMTGKAGSVRVPMAM